MFYKIIFTQRITMNKKLLLYVYCIQLLIYVKVFEHVFILKYHKHYSI